MLAYCTLKQVTYYKPLPLLFILRKPIMKALISSTLDELLKVFALSMASEGKPHRSVMEGHLQLLVDEAQAQRDRRIVMLVNGAE